jgi:predicted ribosome quality control (RQC) complex YloA/Tae2 family protein
VSNTIRYDALFARHLAFELSATLRGAALASVQFDREQRECALHIDGHALIWQLERGPRIESTTTSPSGGLALPRKPRIEQVEAIPDERILTLDIVGGARNESVQRLVFELLPPESDVIALDGAGRVLRALARATSRPQTRGQPYTAPPSRNRVGVDAPISLREWLDLLSSVEPSERVRELVRRIAFISPINAAAVLQTAATEGSAEALTLAHARYVELCTAPPRPCLTQVGDRAQPYGHLLWDPQAIPQHNLLEAIAGAATTAREASPTERIEQSGNAIACRKSRRRLRSKPDSCARMPNCCSPTRSQLGAECVRSN